MEVRLKKGSGGATHMALLRGASDTTWVLHWNRGRGARLWQAAPMLDSTQGLWVPVVPNPQDLSDTVDIFCAGQATMADGRLMVVGGTVVGVTGETRVPVFDPTNFRGSSTNGWTAADTTKFGRWYATVTALKDGRMLATSGTDYLNLQMFGGFRDSMGTSGDSLMNDARALNLRRWLRWNSDFTESSSRPSVRQGHSSVFRFSTGKTVVFGGLRDSSGARILTNQVVQLFIKNVDAGQEWTWESTATDSDPTTLTRPLPRQQHAAVIVGDKMFVYGGLGKNAQGQDVVLSDLWRLDLADSPPEWKHYDVGTGPGARYGHTAVVDDSENNGTAPSILIYGGRTTGGGFADDTVWELALSGTTPQSWAAVATGGPGKRTGHVAIIDTVDIHTVNDPSINEKRHRMVVFGGERDTTGGPKLNRDLWLLSRRTYPASTTWTWTEVAQPLPTNNGPAARTRAMGAYDAEWQRFVLMGGDTDLGAGGEVADVWALRLDEPGKLWTALAQDSTPLGRQAGALVFDPRGVQAKVPERLNLSSGKWEQHNAGSRNLGNYPFLWQMENGKLFYGGNRIPCCDSTSLVYDPDAASSPWTNATNSGFYGGSAVLTYAPAETVMKAGGPYYIHQTAISNRTSQATVASNGNTTWISVVDSGRVLPDSRRLHQLTIVPDGRVLLTGGWKADPDPQDPEDFDYGMTPFFFHNGTWGPRPANLRLADDLVQRSYHTSAVLLPDARILCAGGPPEDQVLTATIYAPPYLYKDGTTLADRPVITSAPTYTVHYNEPFYVDVKVAPDPDSTVIDSIKILSLIRPGAATHSFDQSQRYVSLTPYTITHGMLRTVLTDNAGKVPPGDYLLFAVRTGVGGIPSVAKWVRIAHETDATAPASAGLTYSDAQSSSIVLKWNAPGDDGTTGTATQYSLRKRLSTDGPITEANFFSNDTVATGLPRPTGGQEQALAENLSTCTTYFFGLKTRDERTNGWSAANVIVVGTTGCGGGGGGQLPESARPVEDGPIVANEQLLRLGSRTGGAAGLTIAHSGPTAQVDSAAILYVPRSGSTMTLVADDRLEVVERRSPERVLRNGAEIEVPAGLEATPGDRLIAHFAAAEVVRGLVVETGEADPGNIPERRGDLGSNIRVIA